MIGIIMFKGIARKRAFCIIFQNFNMLKCMPFCFIFLGSSDEGKRTPKKKTPTKSAAAAVLDLLNSREDDRKADRENRRVKEDKEMALLERFHKDNMDKLGDITTALVDILNAAKK